MRAATMLFFGAPSACVADPLTELCPVDALVITEIRGPQSGADTFGQWIEIQNVSTDSIDLRGLHLSNRELDDSNEHEAIVRYRRELAPGDQFVMGAFYEADKPAWVDYALDLDWRTSTAADANLADLHENGFVELRGCGETIDEVVYHRLPTAGSHSLGLHPPDAEGNDDEDAWCTDDFSRRIRPPVTELGKPGSPGEANPACP